MEQNFQDDIDAVGRIGAIPSILKVVCESTGMGFAAVARVTEGRWIACQVLDNVDFGLPVGGELKVETTLCHEVRAGGREIVIADVASDPVYANHHTPRIYNLQSYISVPITLGDGTFFGTLCAISTKPANIKNDATIGMFRLFAELIAHHLDADQKLGQSRADLMSAKSTSDLREQFLAVLGHDLKNPLASIEAGTNLLTKTPLNEKATTIVELMRKSVTRMNGLVDNILDLARGRLGGGIVLETAADEEILRVIEQVVAELRSAHPEREIISQFGELGRLSYDRVRVGQLVSNLLGNALTHGAVTGPVTVRARIDGELFVLSVANEGQQIPPALIEQLFQPFVRASVRPNQPGLGLGLYIASEIARAHGGTLTATSSAEATEFTFKMPKQ